MSESRDDWANSITVTSTLFFGDGDLDFGQGGRGEPPVEDPSGEGRSMDGDGEGEGLSDLGEVKAIELLFDDLGVSGLEAPGDIDVGLGDNKVNFSLFSGVSACTEEGGEETGDDAEAVEEDEDVAEDDDKHI